MAIVLGMLFLLVTQPDFSSVQPSIHHVPVQVSSALCTPRKGAESLGAESPREASVQIKSDTPNAGESQKRDQAEADGEKCEDDIKDCGKPVRKLIAAKGCACFTCYTGTKKEKRICTKSVEDIKILTDLAAESNPPAP